MRFAVKLGEGAWNQFFIDELCALPNGAHDDPVDAASAAFRLLVWRVLERGGSMKTTRQQVSAGASVTPLSF